MALRIRVTSDVPSNLMSLLSAGVALTAERHVDAAKKDFREAVEDAYAAGQAALEHNTPASEFPAAENPPARRRTGKMYSAFTRDIDVGDDRLEAEVGWRSGNHLDYFRYQEKGFDHAQALRHIRGVSSLEFARQQFIRSMDEKGY